MQTFCLQGLNNQVFFISVKNEAETQKQGKLSETNLLQQQQQPLLVLQQPHQQQQFLPVQSPQSERLLVVPQAQQQPQQPLLVVQKSQSQQKKLISNESSSQDPLSQLPITAQTKKTLKKRITNPKFKELKKPRLSKAPKKLTKKSTQTPKSKEPAIDRGEPDQKRSSVLAEESTSAAEQLLSTSLEKPVNEDSDNDNNVDASMMEIYTRLPNGGYRCNVCMKIRMQRRYILTHIRGQHSHLRPFKCLSCACSFKSKHALKTHQFKHNLKDGEIYACDKCEYRTQLKGALHYHYYRMHTDEYRFTCDHCGKRFKVKRELADHLATISGEKYMCDICGKFYRGEHSVRAHRRLHFDLYKFQCTVCKRKLATEKSLNNHMKLHSRTYECDECGMKFPNKHNLIKHRNVHTREQAFTCPECGKIFADQATQKVHSLTHAGLKPYRCNVCGMSFTQRTPMMMHWRKKHPGETEPPPPVILKNILKTIEEQNEKKKKKKKK